MEHLLRLVDSARPTAAEGLYAGHLLRAIIVQRTAAGLDSEEAPFLPYTDKYRAQKVKRGRSGRVDLFGAKTNPHMMNAIQVRIKGPDHAIESFEVGFYTQEVATRAQVHNEGRTVRTRLGTGRGILKVKSGGKASFPMPRRHFFDANAHDLQQMAEGIREKIMARVNQK